MRTWLYDHLSTDQALADLWAITLPELATRVLPRQSQSTINITKPFLVYGMGNNTNEDLAEAQDHEAHRQFFQIWIHDEGGDYGLIDDTIPVIKARLVGASHVPSKVSQVRWLETSAEFDNETYNTLFRYVRFQAIISEGALA